MIDLPDPDYTADDVLRTSGIRGLPIDVNLVASRISGLEVVEDDLDGEGLFFDLGIRGAQIMLRRGAHPLRKKFTLAHEIGHFFVREQAAVYARSQKPKKVSRNVEIERWCNRFAASLIMPRDALLDYLRSAKLKGLLDAVGCGPTLFGVSNAAFRSRIAEISPTSIYGFFPTDRRSRRDSMYLSEKKETHWKPAYNEMLQKLLSNTHRSDVVFLSDVVIVSGWTSFPQNSPDSELLIIIMRSQATQASQSPIFKA
ncbi:ImmA/IrrE family metallo-endopeptidase [Mesorhizobium sp. LNJC394B00]|uniref:ImmA/IrrE family metallo-endopeptidase n=1 Tax=Mesorhizobium sp. LNJC394B00 TaxID=1287274 RepID=UPI000A047C17|nr:ImmA/IrrE family metallo-endopeptidase [Mesorhizobium sp. LNJC394B00]